MIAGAANIQGAESIFMEDKVYILRVATDCVLIIPINRQLLALQRTIFQVKQKLGLAKIPSQRLFQDITLEIVGRMFRDC